MRLIAERLLPCELSGATFLQGAVSHTRVGQQPQPRSGCTRHIYCSPYNTGSEELMAEVRNSINDKATNLNALNDVWHTRYSPRPQII